MRLALALVALALLAGCVEAGIDAIDDARDRRRANEPQESTEGPGEPLGPPTPTRAPDAAPAPPAPPPPAAPLAPTETAAATPSPDPTPATPGSPTALPPAPAPPWPREGSYVRVEVWMEDGARAWANWSYHGTDWRGSCEGPEGAVERTASDPPHWPLFNTRDVEEPGDDLRAWYLDGCDIRSLDASYDGAAGGRLFASAPAFRTSWDAATGLVMEWERGGSTGRLAATDAPLARG